MLSTTPPALCSPWRGHFKRRTRRALGSMADAGVGTEVIERRRTGDRNPHQGDADADGARRMSQHDDLREQVSSPLRRDHLACRGRRRAPRAYLAQLLINGGT
jgi:hypothetical protein